MTNFYTSDSHWGHVRICELANRPFASVEEMGKRLILNWNSVVKPDDVVYHLGDFCFHPRAAIPAIRKQLNGKIVLVWGNHDNVKKQPEFYKTFDDVVGSDMVQDWHIFDYDHKGEVWTHTAEYSLFLHHEPIPSSEWSSFADLMLCGHVHQSWAVAPSDSRILNVGVDVCDFRPMTLTEILNRPAMEAMPLEQRNRDLDGSWTWDAGPGPGKKR